MFKISTMNKISSKGLGLLPKDKYQVGDNLENADGIILRSQKLLDYAFPQSVKAVARAGAGVNNIPVDVCSEKGIVVFNTPGANANGVKELVITGLLLSSRKVVQGINWAKGLVGSGEDVAKAVEKGKSDYEGPEIKGKKLGVVGLGAIGVMVANAALALEMEVIGYDPYLSVNAAWGLSRSVKKAADLNQLYAECDYISVHVPLNDQTREMINKEKIASMKNGVRILNFSRAELVCDKDMIAALNGGKVACYVTDFPEEEILKCENVIGIPHLGASTPESEENCAIMATEQIMKFLETGNIVNSVNFPDCDLNRSQGTARLTLLHKNIPNMVGQISTILANAKLNIDDMLNKSKGELAYTIIDVHAGTFSDDIVAQLNGIEGMIKIRVL
ncbi:MAG: 3-phosphoglycerate dehydrogenase [Spirochaetae bacterium HGW-Spirochaetae-6]|nr:MAG: 3-phosphoglycerate dehydrogenase [Spirochaetae bacterium HGW-Spirochaetae-6]